MMEWILTGILAGLVILAITIYNQLVADSQHVSSGWSDIGVQLKRRHDLIPKLITAVKQYAAYEQATLENITAIRNQAQKQNQVEQQASLEAEINRGLIQVYALQEDYPELKANLSFLQLQTEISAVESDIQYARRFYNGAVRNLNTRIDRFPDLLVAKIFRFSPAAYFEV